MLQSPRVEALCAALQYATPEELDALVTAIGDDIEATDATPIDASVRGDALVVRIRAALPLGGA